MGSLSCRYFIAISDSDCLLLDTKSSKKPSDSIRKKTDEAVPDVNEQQALTRKNDDEEDDEEAEEIDDNKIKTRTTNVTGKDALENQDEQAEEKTTHQCKFFTTKISEDSFFHR